MNTNLEYYKIFYYVATLGSFTKAAKALGSNQPNVTRIINKLENELSIRLLIRSHHGITLTNEGEKLYYHIEKAMKQITEGEAELLKHRTEQKITIAITPIAMNLCAFDVLLSFHKKYPDISMSILNMFTPQAIKAVQNAQADLAIVTSPLNEPILDTKCLMTFDDVLTASYQRKALGTSKHLLKEFKDTPFIGMNASSSTYEHLTKIFSRHHLHYHNAIEVSSVDQLIPFVKEDFGLAFIPFPIALTAIRKGELIEVPLKKALPQRAVYLVCGTRVNEQAANLKQIFLKKSHHS